MEMLLEHAEKLRATHCWPDIDAGTMGVVQQLRDLASRLENGAFPINEAMAGQPGDMGAKGGDRPDYLMKVRAVLQERRLRQQVFGLTFVDDPAWAIMLDLFEAYLTQSTRCIKSSAIASGVPSTTALRYLAQLEESGMIERRVDVCDKRRMLVELADLGRRKLLSYFQRI